MTTPVISVLPSSPLKSVARLLSEHRFRILPVVSQYEEVLGVVSERDFLLKQRGRAAKPSLVSRLLGTDATARRENTKIDAVTAGEAMTSPAVTVDAEDRIERVAGIMLERRVGSLPVVDRDRLVGIVVRSDLMRLFTASDEDLADSIRHDVVQRTLLLPPEQFEVRVIFGVVRIRGHVRRRLLADLIKQAITRHPGVIRVDAEITWDLDDRMRPATLAVAR
jgi:CBS domain-containing protein